MSPSFISLSRALNLEHNIKMHEKANVRGFVALTALGAIACVAAGVSRHNFSGVNEFLCYLAVMLLASSLKVSVPGINGTLSVSFVFLLIGILEMTYVETLILAVTSVLVQSYWRPAKPLRPIQTIFNLSQVIVATSAAFAAFRLVRAFSPRGETLFGLTWAAIVYFAFNTSAMSAIIALSEKRAFRKVWQAGYLWSFPQYLIGAAVAAVVGYYNNRTGWQISLLTLPVIYAIYRSYCLYVGRLQDGKVHAEQMSSLHLRTIEALALAIEAKDQTTGDHLQRVGVYAIELARELGLNEDETEALRAASVLHDIGKLAVPEHIISKPGKLTPEEFEKMKIHPIVGAEILEQVDFPYPVAPIVRAHHEKWNGSGYPDGVSGEAIPIGARILSAVDCLDALASDRQYRKALPLEQAMAIVVSESGKAFDPKVIAILERGYVEWEKLARSLPLQAPPKLSTDIKVERGMAPDAGFAQPAGAGRDAIPEESMSSLAGAQASAQTLFAVHRALGDAVSLDDTLSLIAVRLKRLLAHDALVVFLRHGDRMIAEFVTGENLRLFSSLKVPLGDGICGWVAQNHKPILNANPAVEPGYADDPNSHKLGSALAVPLEGATGIAAVLALYRSQPEAFSKEDLEVVEALVRGSGTLIEEASRPRAAAVAAGAL
jgi:putative nucleotidyltransferase with HDIG domain